MEELTALGKQTRLLSAFYDTPWAIIPERLIAMREVLHRWAAGVKLDGTEIEAAVGADVQAAAGRRQPEPGAVAVIPIYGIISHRMRMVANISGPGGTSTEGVAQALRRADRDPNIGAIVLDIDSPGGSVYGIQELAAEIRGSDKKVVAVANSMAASAAYWLGAAADEFSVTPSGQVGSIGVYGAHEDLSGALEEKGIKVTLVSAGKYKVEGNPYEPLGDEAREAMQAMIDRYYDAFVKGVAESRGVSATDVRNGYGEGRIVAASDALDMGMVDRVETLDDTLARLSRSRQAQSRRRRTRAAVDLARLK